jgi:azurin
MIKKDGDDQMASNQHPHAVRLYQSMRKHTGQMAAERLAMEHPLSKTADTDRKAIWADGICACLEKEFDDETIRKARMDCACGQGPGKMNSLKKVYQSSADAADFVRKANRLNQGFT